MIDSLRPATIAPVPCKICGGASTLFGVLDFNRCCLEHQGIRLPLCGVPIYYRRCGNCGFLFTDAFDDWNADLFKAHIYNDGYGAVDPSYQTVRPRSNAEFVVRLWGPHKLETRVLDYGGGSDAFCAMLRSSGFPVVESFDPMVTAHARPPDQKFDLVTCFETLEHSPDPAASIALIVKCVAEPGLVMYSTLVQPADFENIGLNWWYAGPRNGHVSLFSKQALQLAWGRHGYNNVSVSEDIHFAFRTLPSYSADLIK
jgi:hypothetical protein